MTYRANRDRMDRAHRAVVLHIVYLTEESGISKGGFYPNGMNGKLKTT